MSATHVPARDPEFHPALVILARIVSFVFHPLFIPVYIIWFLLYYTSIFAGIDGADKGLLLIRFLIMYTVFPLMTVLIARALGFVKTIYMRDAKDRIIPYIACGVYYFWMWWVLKNQTEFPREIVMLSLGIFLASSAGLIANSFVKVSMHGMSVGVMIAFILLIAFTTDENMGFYISIAMLIAGTVCTARLINSEHSSFEIYLGLLIGIMAEVIAYLVV
jgi:hypothetical protein